MDQNQALQWIEQQASSMQQQLLTWCHINSGTLNLAGLARMSAVLKKDFAVLQGQITEHELQPWQHIDDSGNATHTALGQGLSIQKRPQAPLQVLLCGHMDTVYGADHSFQHCQEIADGRVQGPGVADMKGGLLVILYALQALEHFTDANNLGWTVFINTDEEIGSPGSAHLLSTFAAQHHLGLVFEPSVDETGTLAGARKGSGKFAVVAKGKAAHAGRAFAEGRNAIVGLAHVVQAIAHLNGQRDGVTINVGKIQGGQALNVVPDTAVAHLDIRIQAVEDETWVHAQFERIQQQHNLEDISIEISGGFTRKPKLLVGKTLQLFETVAQVAKELQLSLHWQSSGGCCDGNNLAAAGLPVVDTLGVRGGNIHSSEEYIILDSLAERAKLTALLLMKLASGEIKWN